MAQQVEHGTVISYKRGCKCRPCKDANAAYVKEKRRARLGKRLLINGKFIAPSTEDGGPIHGLYTTYTSWGCKCSDCSSAFSRYRFRVKAKPYVCCEICYYDNVNWKWTPCPVTRMTQKMPLS